MVPHPTPTIPTRKGIATSSPFRWGPGRAAWCRLQSDFFGVFLDGGETLTAYLANLVGRPWCDHHPVDAHGRHRLELVEGYPSLQRDGRELERLVFATGGPQLLADGGDVAGAAVPPVSELGGPRD